MARIVIALIFVAMTLPAQRGGGGRGGGRIGPPPSVGANVVAVPPQLGARSFGQGFGNVVFPGGVGGANGVPNPFYSNATTFAQRFGATVSGYPGYTPGGPAPSGRGRGGAAVVPYAFPVYVGGYGYGGYGSYYQPQQPVVIQQAAPQPAPTVIINQHYTPDRAQPVTREYKDGELPQPSMQSYQAPVPSFPDPPKRERGIDAEKPTIYLIAMRDGTVYSALAYWVEGGSLHYITTKHSHNQATLDLVDTGLSAQLNGERNVEFTVR